MKCAVQIYMVLGGFHVYKSVFLGWVVGPFNIAVNWEHNCGVPPYGLRIYAVMLPPSDFSVAHCEGIDDMCRVEHIVFLSFVR